MSKIKTRAATHTVTVRRSGDWWSITIDDVPGAFTQARRLDQVEIMARDVIGLMLDVPTDSFDVNLNVHLPPQAEDETRRVAKARQELVDAQAAFSDATRTAAKTLTARCGLTVRDAGRVLGLSHQRVDQLLHSR